MLWLWRDKYKTLGDVNAESEAEYGDTMADPEWTERYWDFRYGRREYNWPLLRAIILAIILVPFVIWVVMLNLQDQGF